MFRFVFLITIALLTFVIIAEAQSNAPPAVAGAQIGVPPAPGDDVTVDLIVRDRRGHPVRDLRPEEIHVTDDGVRAGVTRLNLVTRNDNHLVSLVFDGVDAISGRLAHDGAMELLNASPGGVRFSVWKIHDRLALLQDFTMDRDALKRAVESATLAATPAAARPGATAPAPPAAPDSMKAQVASASERLIRDERFHPCLARLLALTQRLGAYPGRKTILYLSNGVDVTAATAGQLWSAIGSANNAGVSVYALDITGLTKAAKIAAYGAAPAASDADAEGDSASAGVVEPEAPKEASGAAQSAAEAAKYDNRLPLKKLAEATGGVCFEEVHDARFPIARIIEDLSAHYEATYQRPPSGSDGRFRAVSVSVARKGVSVQARAGYFALPANSPADLRPFEVPLFSALGGSERTDAIPFHARVLRFGWKDGKAQAELVVEIPLHAFECAGKKDAPACRSHLSILALVRDGKDRVVGKFSLDRPYQMNAARLAEAQKDSFTFQRAFAAPPGDYQVDIAVADRLGNKLSEKRVPLSIPPQSPGVLLSDLSLVRRLEPLTPFAEGEPLQYQGRLIVADLAAEWPRGERSVPVFVTVYPAAGGPGKPQLEMELIRDAQTIARLPATLPDSKPGDSVPFVTALKSSALTPGSYQVKARVTQAGAASERIVSFTVTPASAPQQSQPSASALSGPFETGPELLRDLLKPGDAEMKRILDAARQRALSYRNDLTNFVCIEVTRRMVDHSGAGDWKPRDTITQVMQYIDGAESTDLLEVKGDRQPKKQDTEAGRVFGEFSRLLDLVFSKEAGAEIEWQDVADWKGSRVNIFRYSVPRSRSKYLVMASVTGRGIYTAYKGLIYIEANTMAVRSVSLEATNMPKDFPVYRADITVDYDWVQIAGQEYLMPQLTTLYVGSGKHLLMKTEKEFRDYRRYDVGADWKIGSK